MKQTIFLILLLILFVYLSIKIIKFLFPVLLFIFIFFMISSLFKSKPKMPENKFHQSEVIKDVEIRVLDEEPETKKAKT